MSILIASLAVFAASACLAGQRLLRARELALENGRLIAHLNMATESAGIASWELDLVTRRYLWIQNPIQSLLHARTENMDVDAIEAHVVAEDRALFREVVMTAIANHTDRISLRYRAYGGDGKSIVYVQNFGRIVLDPAGVPARLLGVSWDVTAEVTASELLRRQTAQAQAASLAKSHFLANVSHEIRTPMNGIIGMTGLLLDTPLERTQRDYAETIRSSADSLLAVINDILDFSKIEAGKLELESIEFDLRANVEDVGALMALQAAVQGLELIVNVDPQVAARVLGDPQRLRQCLTNLVSNAVKFTKSGEIVIEVRPEIPGEVGLTRFEVRDTGMGIAAETLATLFQPFVQADSSTTRHFGGTGLGLSIVRRLVDLMGGKVGVASEVGAGSCFFFTLPLMPAAAQGAAPAAAERRGGKILIVDDNVTNQRVLRLQLRHAGYEVTALGDGQAALRALDAAHDMGHPFDLVITDFQMPDMDGAMLGELIVKRSHRVPARLVMLTSLDRHGDTLRLAALGFAAYLTKPVRVQELLDAVTRVMTGAPRQRQTDQLPMITRNTLAQAAVQQRFDGHVLLVEDNFVNQKVASRFLERLGCTVQVAGNGADGVTAYVAKRFDMVLMDLQMPIMDGIAATRTIRELERSASSASSARRRVPIIALTANAMTGDRERCEAAGMDGYLTKPMEVERLRSILSQFGLARRDDTAAAARAPDAGPRAEVGLASGASGAAQRHAEAPGNAPPVHLGNFNAMTGGDAAFAQELITAFVASGEQVCAEAATAVARGERAKLSALAHRWKGACANMHSLSLRALAEQLEACSGSADTHTLEQHLARMRGEFERAKQFLRDPAVVPHHASRAS